MFAAGGLHSWKDGVRRLFREVLPQQRPELSDHRLEDGPGVRDVLLRQGLCQDQGLLLWLLHRVPRWGMNGGAALRVNESREEGLFIYFCTHLNYMTAVKDKPDSFSRHYLHPSIWQKIKIGGGERLFSVPGRYWAAYHVSTSDGRERGGYVQNSSKTCEIVCTYLSSWFVLNSSPSNFCQCTQHLFFFCNMAVK